MWLPDVTKFGTRGTFRFWVKHATIAGLNSVILSTYNGSGSTASNEYLVRILTTNYSVSWGTNSGNAFKSVYRPASNTWTSLTGTWDSTSYNLYVNGVLDVSKTLGAIASPVTTHSPAVGEDSAANTGSNTDFLDGYLFCIGFWSIPLTAREVQDQYNLDLINEAFE